MEPSNIGTNIKATVNGTNLLLEIDMSQDHGPSSSGKTNTVAKSGFADVPGLGKGFGFTLNVWRPKAAAAK